MLAEGIELTSIASTTEIAEAASFIEGDEVATMVVATETELGSIVASEAAVAAEVAGVASTEAACSWNIVRLVFRI